MLRVLAISMYVLVFEIAMKSDESDSLPSTMLFSS